MPTTPQNNLNQAETEPSPINESQLGSNHLDPTWYPRPVISTLDTWDDLTRPDYHYSVPSVGKRPLFNVPSVAITSESVNTIQSSFNKVGTAGTSIATQAAMSVSPTNTQVNIWKVVPTMAQNLYVTSSVQVSWMLNIITTASSSPRFAVYRDGQPISQIFHQDTQPNLSTLVTGTYVDASPSLLRYHVYDLRWNPTDTPVTADRKNRTFQASNLRAQ